MISAPLSVRRREVVPPARLNPSAAAVRLSPLTVLKVGVADAAKVIVPAALLVVVIFDPAVKVSVPPWIIDEFEPLLAATLKSVPPDTRQVGQAKVKLPPSETDPPPLKGPLVLIVKLELAKLALVMPAEPERLALVRPATAVLVRLETLPCWSVVMTGITVAEP